MKKILLKNVKIFRKSPRKAINKLIYFHTFS